MITSTNKASAVAPLNRDWARQNVLMLTLDCCRFDTLLQARTPVLDSLGHVRRAETHGTFTLPAHMSFFTGYLPSVNEPPFEDYYSRQGFQLWRLARGKFKDPKSYGLLLEGNTILAGFRKLGFSIIGAGGVRWFTKSPLTELFDEFHFWGPDDYKNMFATRQADDFALAHADFLMERIQQAGRPFFLFINSSETHVPYDFGEPLSPEIQEILERARPLWGGKFTERSFSGVSKEEFSLLREQQIRAIEAVDKKIGKLLEILPRPTTVVVCGDHGECFGEDLKWGHGFPHESVWTVPLIVGFHE